jgi:hypothetical protein
MHTKSTPNDRPTHAENAPLTDVYDPDVARLLGTPWRGPDPWRALGVPTAEIPAMERLLGGVA